MIKKIFENTKKKLSNTLTYKVTMTIDLIFIIFCVLLTALYVIGNFQNFQDSSQQIILFLLSYFSIFSGLLSFVLLIESLVKVFTEKFKLKNIFYSILLALAIIFCIFSTSLASIISYLSTGIAK